MVSIFDPSFHYEEAKSMAYRPLGTTDMKVSKIGLGGASFGNIYDDMDEDVCTKMTEKALKSGINFIDTSPWYGQGLSEKRIGVALKNIPRDKYFIATKVGRYEKDTSKMFNFTVAKIQESFQQSLDNLQLPYVDLIQVHDCEFSGSIDQIVKKVLPTLLEFKKEGKARYIGITSYNLGVLKKIVKLAEPGTIDTVLTYGRCNLVNQDLLDDLDFFKQRNIGVINASPLALGLLNNDANWPEWHIAPKITKDVCKKAAQFCKDNDADLAMIGMQYSFMQDDYIATHLSSMINEYQLVSNVKAVRTSPDSKMIKKLKNIFDDLPISQWENLETTKYWDKMNQHGWKQPLDY